MNWPWSKREQRADTYTDAVIEYLQNNAAGDVVAGAPAALEIAAGLWGRSFASATVMPETAATSALTPSILEAMGRRLLKTGEALFVIEVNGSVHLRPAASWTVGGGVDEAEWTYRVTEHAPRGESTRTYPSDAVVHVRIGVDTSEPWKGHGPLQEASTSTALARSMEARLGQEAGARVGNLLPVPEVKQELQNDIAALKGQTVLVRSAADGWDAGKGRAELKPQRLGFAPPPEIEPLRDSVSRSLLAAAGVPAALLGNADGSLLRESQRQFLHTTVTPVARIAAEELALKLDTPGLRFDHSSMYASDITGRARAFGSMVKAGMDVQRAAILSGLISDED